MLGYWPWLKIDTDNYPKAAPLRAASCEGNVHLYTTRSLEEGAEPGASAGKGAAVSGRWADSGKTGLGAAIAGPVCRIHVVPSGCLAVTCSVVLYTSVTKRHAYMAETSLPCPGAAPVGVGVQSEVVKVTGGEITGPFPFLVSHFFRLAVGNAPCLVSYIFCPSIIWNRGDIVRGLSHSSVS